MSPPKGEKEKPPPDDDIESQRGSDAANASGFKTEGDAGFFDEITRTGLFAFFFTALFESWPEINAVLLTLTKNDNLLPVKFGSGRYSSGYSFERIREMIRKKIPGVDRIMTALETEFVITNGWVAVYTKLGKFRWHPDKKYLGAFRLVITLGAYGKIMWIRETGGRRRIVGVHLPHCSVVLLSRVGGGVDGQKYEHAITGGKWSWTIIFELARKKEVELTIPFGSDD